ncbi:protein LURP-one-related 11 [Nicotiana tabacum]|uniref:Protein LURP-one-related 11 n=1 Tax=Nicotiana tabacum TaxID=4097 RepID=A0A1S4DI85_TOBAC|nr:PREDICTED: protein LURP-one-related 11-like [Nicotiana tabacum]
MAKVYSNKSNLSTISSSSSISSNSYMSPRREIFTLWMKSLVYHGNGCTVYDSKGQIVYRIDNYNIKRSKEVHLMDSNGRVLFSIRNRKVPVFGHWDGYKWSYEGVTSKEIPWFQVKKIHNVLRGDNMNYYNVILGCNQAEANCYNIILGTTSIKIVTQAGRLVAEVKQKQATSGVLFGSDVLTLVVEPHVDHSLVMALVTVCGLIHHKI